MKHGMNPADKIVWSLWAMNTILEDYHPNGDWWGCVKNARDFLMEAMKSYPPGGGREADYGRKTNEEKWKGGES